MGSRETQRLPGPLPRQSRASVVCPAPFTKGMSRNPPVAANEARTPGVAGSRYHRVSPPLGLPGGGERLGRERRRAFDPAICRGAKPLLSKESPRARRACVCVAVGPPFW